MVRPRPCTGHHHQDMVLLLLRPDMVHRLLDMERLHHMDSLRLKTQMPSISSSDR